MEEQDNTEQDFDAQEQFEDNQQMQQEYYDNRVGGDLQTKDDIHSLFWKVVMADNTSKIGNLKKEELGMLPFTVRDCQLISLKAELLGRTGFALFFREMSEMILSTSLSRDMALLEKFVTRKNISEKRRGSNSDNLIQNQQHNKNNATNKTEGFMR